MILTLPAAAFAGGLVLAADTVPTLNIDPTCSAAGNVGVIVGRTKESCMRDENDARDQLRKQWSGYPAGDKSRCIASTSDGGVPSYVELLTCLEIAKQARELPDETVGRGPRPPR
ncbi:MAG TPA: hypothetical protein VHA55_14720 [Pseudorhodoplanes sp.]|jgi:hypothetical protein|nr:hypothetical protein [Pseudorhodoplanes sp.]